MANNPRTRAIFEGKVKPDGVSLICTPLHASELFWRQLRFGDFDVSEMSMSSFLMAIAGGDTRWVGHTMQELHSALGAPSFSLGKPYHMVGGPDYRIDVYTAPQAASAVCIDAYKLNECGVITDYFCR